MEYKVIFYIIYIYIIINFYGRLRMDRHSRRATRVITDFPLTLRFHQRASTCPLRGKRVIDGYADFARILNRCSAMASASGREHSRPEKKSGSSCSRYLARPGHTGHARLSRTHAYVRTHARTHTPLRESVSSQRRLWILSLGK